MVFSLLPSWSSLTFTLTSSHLQKIQRGEGKQAALRGGDGGNSAERELTAMPPVLKVSFHSFLLLGPSHPRMQDTQKPPVRGEEAALDGREELAQGD